MALCISCDDAVALALKQRRKRDEAEALARRLRLSGLPFDYASGARNLSSIPMRHADVVTALQMIGNGVRGLYLWGPAKAWKTTAAASFLANHIRGGSDGRYVFVPDLMEDIIASYKRNDDDESRQQILDRCSSSAALVLDDVGKEKASDHSAKALLLILDYRQRHYRPGHWLIVTSQFSLGELAARFPVPEDGDAIKHRLSNLTVSVPMGAS